MTMVNMSHFMNKDFPPVFLQVFPADDNILHPTERSYLLIMHHKCNPFLAHYTFGNTYQYYPVVSEEDFRKGTLRNVISKYFNNSYLNAVSSLVKEEDISLDELKQLIEEVEQADKKH
jgi:hypothetical protein